MAEQFTVPVPAATEITFPFELPVSGTFGAQSQTFISILAIQPSGGVPVTATYKLQRVDLAVEATVPAFGQPPAPINSGGNTIATVQLVNAITNGLATILITHTPSVSDEEPWSIKVSHAGGVSTDFFGVIAHTQPATQVPQMSLIIGAALNPASPTLDYGSASFNATRTRSVVVFNTGTGPFTLGALALSVNPTNFYAITTNPSGTALNPNGQSTVAIGYTPTNPPAPPAPPHTGTLSIPSTTGGVAAKVVSLTGSAVFREIVLCIDASDSMNADSAGASLSGCPVATTKEPDFNTRSRIRQVRAAVELFRTKLIEYSGDEQTLLGIVQFPGGDLACGSSYNDALNSNPSTWKTQIQALTVFNDTDATVSANIATATDDAYYHATPMTAGLQEAINTFSGASGNFRSIILLSDGAHNVPTDTAQKPTSLIPTLTNVSKRIRVLAIGFGDSGSLDHALLQQLADQTAFATGSTPFSGYFQYNPTAPNNADLLSTFYSKVFTNLFELQTAVDPVTQIARGGTNQHKVLVTELDERVTFSVAWETPLFGLLAVELIAPNGDRITPNSQQVARYYQGQQHKMYAVDVAVTPDFLGEWIIEVFYGRRFNDDRTHNRAFIGAQGPATERYTYDVTMRSDLELTVSFDKARYGTGSRIVISAALTEQGRAMLDQTVRVKIKRPGEAIGNWYADHPVPVATLKEGAAVVLGSGTAAFAEHITPVMQKTLYLTQVAGVPLPAYVEPFGNNGVLMQDDGANGDFRAQDGIYTAVLDGISTKPGTYSFTVVATGKIAGGRDYRREKLIHINVQNQIDLTLEFTQVLIQFLGRSPKGLKQFRAFVRPQDHLGNLLGPGFGEEIVIKSSLGMPLTAEVTDDLSGGYYRDFEYSEAAGVPVVEIEIGGQPLPPQNVKEDPGGLVGWLGQLAERGDLMSLLLILALLLALIIILILLFGS